MSAACFVPAIGMCLRARALLAAMRYIPAASTLGWCHAGQDHDHDHESEKDKPGSTQEVDHQHLQQTVMDSVAEDSSTNSVSTYDCPVCRKAQLLDLDRLQVVKSPSIRTTMLLMILIEGLAAIALCPSCQCPTHGPAATVMMQCGGCPRAGSFTSIVIEVMLRRNAATQVDQHLKKFIEALKVRVAGAKVSSIGSGATGVLPAKAEAYVCVPSALLFPTPYLG